MAKKKGIGGWLLIGGIVSVVGFGAAWYIHPPFRRTVCNSSIGSKFPPCKQEPGYVANENDLNPENYRGNITPGLSNEIQQALDGTGPLGTAIPPGAAARMRAYAVRRGNRKRLPKLRSSR